MKKVVSAKDLLMNNDFLSRIQQDKAYIHEEFQDFGFRLAVRLDDLKHRALYIKFAKEIPRSILNEAMEFSLDYPLKNGTKAKVFMWKLNTLCKQKGVKMSYGFVKKEKKIKLKPQLELL